MKKKVVRLDKMSNKKRIQPTFWGSLGAFWGLFGISFLLFQAIYRLTPIAIEALQSSLTSFQWLSLVLFSVFMAYSEGWKGFQKGFSPRVAARARYLTFTPTFLLVTLAPLFCMGFFHATRKRKIVAYSLTTGIILLILAVRFLPQPWRGIIDCGVVIGLTWGLLSLFYFSYQAFLNKEFDFPSDIPERK